MVARRKRVGNHSHVCKAFDMHPEYSVEELVWMNALHVKALELGRCAVTDLTAGEILDVARKLGWRKVKTMTVEEARKAYVCRICEKPCGCGPPGPLGWQTEFGSCVYPEAITLNFGDEYAHTACLEKVEQPCPVSR